jgi:hypothetical protein
MSRKILPSNEHSTNIAAYTAAMAIAIGGASAITLGFHDRGEKLKSQQNTADAIVAKQRQVGALCLNSDVTLSAGDAYRTAPDGMDSTPVLHWLTNFASFFGDIPVIKSMASDTRGNEFVVPKNKELTMHKPIVLDIKGATWYEANEVSTSTAFARTLFGDQPGYQSSTRSDTKMIYVDYSALIANTDDPLAVVNSDVYPSSTIQKPDISCHFENESSSQIVDDQHNSVGFAAMMDQDSSKKSK